MRLTLSILMIAAVIAGFALFIVPTYGDISALRAQEADYNTILANARTLQQERNTLVQKYNAFDPGELARLNTLLPTNPHNVSLILELDAVAAQYGMVLQNVKIDDSTAAQPAAARPGTTSNTDVGDLGITFSVSGSYDGFVSFIKTIERSLRIIDIQKISFAATGTTTAASPNYQYTVGIKTYWLK